jgi:thioredoxin-like negative regulator of GroEL
MESLLAHVARKERGRLRVQRVDVDKRRGLHHRLGVHEIPSLVLIVERRVVARIEGRANLPQIERLLQPYLRAPARA